MNMCPNAVLRKKCPTNFASRHSLSGEAKTGQGAFSENHSGLKLRVLERQIAPILSLYSISLLTFCVAKSILKL